MNRMAYNNYFPTGYNPYAFQPVSAPFDGTQQYGQGNIQGRQATPQSGLIWVSGEAGARGYPIAPNTTVDLWDSESQTVYLKSADASGMPSMKILDYTIRENGKQMNALQGQFDMSNFVTKDELKKALEGIRNESIVRTDKQTAIE